MSDLISREQAIDVLIPIVKSASLRNRNVYSVAKKCMSAIEELPSAERTGKWIPKDNHNCWTEFECSACGHCYTKTHDFMKSKPSFNYCPNCGARMVSEDDT